jgi:hypothetical protein
MNECWCLRCRRPMIPLLMLANGVTVAWTCSDCLMVFQPEIEWNPWTQRFDRNIEPLLTYGRVAW